jgi:hypothetical protein
MGTARHSRRVRPTRQGTARSRKETAPKSCCPDVATMRDDAVKRKLKVVKGKKGLSSDLFSSSTVQTGKSRWC